ncbi:helix-turn-helix domain-containing protein [Chitinophaga qingshengii]|uniref:AraC family transcriptional regulator n=1 Tax=Chitinophaga qingshengii TaxID=1569794 RepID=A0ABR7TXG7_9BACT|nr:AraC family transcriptional regulator [Chitinophaga qingshengii]MBC9934109.1 AraC family transcriptional regulator [Chitinophaga qingshengii]
MGERNLHMPFELFEADMSEWQSRPLIYYFFEIIHVWEGSGTRVVNQNRFPYAPGSVLLFTPRDCRGFEVETPTRFTSVRFSGQFLEKAHATEERHRICQWLKQLEYIFFQHNRHEPILVKHTDDCKMITALIRNMVQEYKQRPPYYETNLQHYVALLLNIIARNVSEEMDFAGQTGEEPLISRMIGYIRQHIYFPDQLKLEVLAAKFNLSVNYIGEFFKKQTGESIQQFIINYKLKLVQLRVENSGLTIGEIADELGFTDESHLSRLFRKYYGVSPAMYRRNKLAEKAGTTA